MFKSLVLAGALALGVFVSAPGTASAAPLPNQAALSDQVSAPVTTVQYGYGYGRRGYGRPRYYGRRFYGGPRRFRRGGGYGRPFYGPRRGFYGY